MFELDQEGVRKIPSQSRSRERQELILGVAEALIAEVGSEALKMGDIARRAGISIGSVYQYYRDKQAVLAALAERCHAEGSACIAAALANATSPAELIEAFEQLIEQYFTLFQTRPAMRDVWIAIQADKQLAKIELAATYHNAALLSEAVGRVADLSVTAACAHSAFAIMALGEATLRLAISLPPDEARAAIQVYQRMTRGELSRALNPAV